MFGEHLEITVSFFTFHNVSINTSDSGDKLFYLLPLHSTMFLLIHTSYPKDVKIVHFTFHNVSINTTCHPSFAFWTSYFTFHNVSINTVLQKDLEYLFVPLHSTMFLLIHHIWLHRMESIWLYIPQCFY